MKKIDTELMDQLTCKARQSPRLRMNHNFHTGPDDTLQRLLNAMEPGTYVRPHKHEDPDKREVFFALRGKLCVVQFDHEGNITDHVVLSPGGQAVAAEIAERTFPTVISLEPGSIAYEAKDGPYNPVDDKNFAAWAPPEKSPEAATYLQGLIGKLGLK
jgi:cupin fold WbuC family metalloprotein